MDGKFQPDEFFTAEQIARMQSLMEKLHQARAGGPPLAESEREELQRLVQAELMVQ